MFGFINLNLIISLMHQSLFKKVITITILVCLCIFFASCSLFMGSDGKDGEVFLSIDWIEQPEYYTDSNPAIPNNFQRGFSYKTEPGDYNFEYAFEDGYGWEGIYTIREAEPGESGSFFRNDDSDGKDAFYSIVLTYNGMIFENEYKTIIGSDKEDEIIFISASAGNFVLDIVMNRIYKK